MSVRCDMMLRVICLGDGFNLTKLLALVPVNPFYTDHLPLYPFYQDILTMFSKSLRNNNNVLYFYTHPEYNSVQG